MPPFLQVNDKYALLAIETVSFRRGVQLPLDLSDTAQAVGRLPVVPNNHWKESLGTLLWERLENCQLFVVVREPSDNPNVLDHESLKKNLTSFLNGFVLTGVPYSDGQHMLSGSVHADGPDIKEHSELEEIRVILGVPRVSVDDRRIRQAYDLARNILDMTNGGWNRLLRGFHALFDALRVRYLEERLHLFVRALDAVLKTPQGKGTKTFIERCNTFLLAHTDNSQTLKDMYDMRSTIEHMHDVELEPKRITDSVGRKRVREQRIRQLEVMTLTVYRRIVGDPQLRMDLGTDAGIDAFWAQPEATRTTRWNAPFDLAAVR